MRDAPVVAGAEVDFERDGSFSCLPTPSISCFTSCFASFQFLLRHFKDQFVMDLEDHLCSAAFVCRRVGTLIMATLIRSAAEP